MFTKFLLLVLFRSSSAVIYELNDEDYALMPPMFFLDNYEECLRDPEGLYCSAEFAVVSDEPSALLTMMQEYSKHTPTHYNHTKLRRGVCITQTCKKFYDESEGDQGSALEACANKTLYSKYKLKAKVSNDFACSKREKGQPIDNVDIAVGLFCVAILVVNTVASICDYFSENGKNSRGRRFLYCFSIFRNWNKLLTPAADGRDPRLKALKGLHGIRTLNMMLVIAGHSLTIIILLPYCHVTWILACLQSRYELVRFLYLRKWVSFCCLSTHTQAKTTDIFSTFLQLTQLTAFSIFLFIAIISNKPFTGIFESSWSMFTAGPFHILINGTLIMQTFLLISSFLLVYMTLIHSEKHEPSWKMLPRQFFVRWLRLTPSYAVVLALTATWFGRLTSGPYWKKTIGNEMSDCRRHWWMHLLYINNYFDNSECMAQSWYLAVDLQLYFMAAIIFVMCRTPHSRKVVLSLLFVLGVVIPTLKTYYWNLDGVLMVFPEFTLEMFQNSPTLDEVYKRGHTNLPGYVMGMALGYWAYDWQQFGGDPKTLRKYRFLYWSLFPLGCLCCYSGTIFYTYSEAPSTTMHLLYAAFLKPVFAFVICTLMAGVIIQFEDIYRPILEWPKWTVPSRLSYSAYLLHIVFLRNYLGMQTTTYRASAMETVTRGTMLVTISFIAAFFFWILVEGPFGNLTREYFTTPGPVEESKQMDKDCEKRKDAEKEKYDANKDEKSQIIKTVAKIVDKISTKKVEDDGVDKIRKRNIEKKL